MRIIIESPYNPTGEQIEERRPQGFHTRRAAWASLLRENIQYARLLVRKALEDGHAPFASHLLYTQVWSEDPEFRTRGIAAGLEWRPVADMSWFGLDLGISTGMKDAKASCPPGKGEHVRLFPDLDIVGVRAHLASLPWSSFEGLP